MSAEMKNTGALSAGNGSALAEGLIPETPMGEAVLVLDRSLRVMGCNTSARRMFGQDLDPDGVIPLQAHLDGPCLGEIHSAIDVALGQGKASYGIRADMNDAQGQRFSVICWVNPLYGPSRQITGVIFGLRDGTFLPVRGGFPQPDQSPSRMPRLGYEALFENLAEGIFTINTRWRITSFNQTAELLTGYSRDEVLGRYCWDIFRSDLCEAGCPLRTTLENGVTRMDQDVRMLGKGGERIAMLVNTNVVKDRQGMVVGAVETFRPISGLEGGLEAGGQRHSFADIIGKSPPMQRLFTMLPDVAASDASVLISGPSGTGKELFARAIHHQSPRKNGPFIAVNCSALAETLLESELFGHEKAAFTGAVRSKVGRFELAKGGTLFLDEIGDLKPELQVKLLRVLEQRVFERVGGTRLIPMEARIISATNKDLSRALAQGMFREDLYYRLRTVPMTLPPLNQRPEDIPLLVQHFIESLNKRYGKEVRGVDPKVMRLFMRHQWPGNVRELERMMEHAYVFVKGPMIFLSNLPALEEFIRDKEEMPAPQAAAADDSFSGSERQAILRALEEAGGRKGKAAQILGISRTTLWRRLKDLAIS
jgi:PAS domain S-box-containing protein